VIGNRVHIGSHSRIGSSVLIEHGAHLDSDSTVPDGSEVLAGAHSRLAPARHRQHRKVKGGIAA